MELSRSWSSWAIFSICVILFGENLLAGPSTVERPEEGVCIVRDDAGIFGGSAMGTTHQRDAGYEAKKILDLSAVSASQWQAVTSVRLSAYFCVWDYSGHEVREANGLDGAIEIIVNGKAHRVANQAGLPVYSERQPMEQAMRWHDFDLPKTELIRGPNEIVFRPSPPPGKVSDDYLYLGIDNMVSGGNSWVKLGGAEHWRQDRLNVPGGKGEYMVRLYLFAKKCDFQAVWRAAEGRTEDPLGVLLYTGSHGDDARMEWDRQKIDKLSPATLNVEFADKREFTLNWLDVAGNAVGPPVKAQGPQFQATLPPGMAAGFSGVRFDKQVPLRTVTFRAGRSYHPMSREIDMAPRIGPAKGAAVSRSPSCRIDGEHINLSNGTLRCRFRTTGGKLRVESLYHEMAAAEMIRAPDQCSLFLLEIDGKRYRGSHDFVCRSTVSKAVAGPAGHAGFTAILASDELKLEAVLSVWIDDALRMGLTVTNRRAKPADFKLAFPHLAGLAISDQPADDYYFFPWGGGIIADAPAIIRRGYGDSDATYQIMDIFSPARGAGLAIACSDEDGRYKVLALRKHVPGQAELNGDMPATPTTEEYKWTNSLPPVAGMGLAYEYLRRTRKPGESFAAKDVALSAHTGDWHAAVESYARWCHRVWQFRPYPSRLTSVVHIDIPGWGQDILFRHGKYRTDFLRPQLDCLELMSWWDWSPLGPGNVPLDQFAAKMGELKFKEWEPYFVKDPVTGQLLFNNNPGDYDGYNPRFGGLAALRDAIASYQKAGKLVMLYTDPMRVDDNSKCGRQWGKQCGVIQPDGSHRRDYTQWRMCLDLAEYRRFVADSMRRVIRETGADGIRMDEFGHCGSACFSTTHRHTFAETGTTEWMRGVAETAKLVHQAMDEVKRGLVLTTEFPGYDFMMQFLDGCLTYDMSVQATPLRPLECNLQRFYFPECKVHEIRYGGADPTFRKRFWNAVGLFEGTYPIEMSRVLRENDDVFSSRDCQPLIPTETRCVYANRFTAGNKTIYMVYNATGHSLAGTVLRLHPRPGEHVFDLLHGREADGTIEKDGTKCITMFLPRDHVVCLLCCPARLVAKRSASLLELAAGDVAKSGRIAICDSRGEPLTSRPMVDGTAQCNLAEIPNKAARPAYAKLMVDGQLIDAAVLP
jgi:hypothetical protein